MDVFSSLLAIAIVLNLLATLAIWRNAARSPKRLKKAFIRDLRSSEPIQPKPQKLAFSALATDQDRRFARDFDEFADILNSWLSRDTNLKPWRVQELPETELT